MVLLSLACQSPAPHEAEPATEAELPSETSQPFTAEEHVDRMEWLRAQIEARGKRRAELRFKAAQTPGWRLHESEHYFIITNVNEEDTIHELERHLEATRALLHREFPPQLPIGGPNLPSLNAVRLFRSSSEFREYGGGGVSSGYFSRADRELVLVEDDTGRTPGPPWSNAQQLVAFEHFGSTLGLKDPKAPSWVLHGVSGYFGSLELQDDGRFELQRQHNLTRIRDHRLGKELPRLGELVNRNSRGHSIGFEALQAWSFIVFLHVGEAEAPVWFETWDGILDRCLDATRRGESPELANVAAFDGVYAPRLEAEWHRWIEQQIATIE